MTQKSIRVKFISDKEMIHIVEDFRGRHWPHGFPVDVEKIVELELGMEIIPAANLWKGADTEAFLATDFKTIIVDKDIYLEDRLGNKLRFALAHEVGHFVLHRDLFAYYQISSAEEYIRFIREIPDASYRRIELQANLFAANLLMPEEILLNKFREKAANQDGVDSVLNEASRYFGVSNEAMKYRLRILDRAS